MEGYFLIFYLIFLIDEKNSKLDEVYTILVYI